jgi:hypothetical protein
MTTTRSVNVAKPAMTTRRSVNVAMPAGGHVSASRPVVARPGFRELVSVWPASGEPTVRAPRPPRPPCHRSSPLTHPLYWYLLECPAVALPGWSIDPGRDMLCILTSPPR